MIKIQILGTSGTGKSILAEIISDALAKVTIDSSIKDDTPHPIERYKFVQIEQFRNKLTDPIVIETVQVKKENWFEEE
jgi:adenylate kinase family enzyme